MSYSALSSNVAASRTYPGARAKRAPCRRGIAIRRPQMAGKSRRAGQCGRFGDEIAVVFLEAVLCHLRYATKGDVMNGPCPAPALCAAGGDKLSRAYCSLGLSRPASVVPTRSDVCIVDVGLPRFGGDPQPLFGRVHFQHRRRGVPSERQYGWCLLKWRKGTVSVALRHFCLHTALDAG